MRITSPRFNSLATVVEQLLKISGTAGVSIGVSHNGSLLHTANYGYRDVEGGLAPDSDTLYWAGSISKSMTAAAIGILVEDKKLSWGSVISDLLPEFQHYDADIRQHCTITNLLSHTSGLGGKDSYWQRDHARLMIKAEDFLKTASYLPVVNKLGSMWSPANWNYGIADHVIARATGMSYGSFLDTRLFQQLGMKRTTLDVSPKLNNVAQAYLYSPPPEGPFHIGTPRVGDGTIMAGAMGVKSTVNDLLAYTEGLMHAAAEQKSTGTNTTEGSPFTQVSTLLQPHVSTGASDERMEREGFALGWVRTQLPMTMSAVSINEGLVEKYPTIGKGLAKPPVIYYHAGSVVGYLASVTMIPETQSSIVVLSNTLSNQDMPDWVGLLLLEELLEVAKDDRVDFIPYAKEAASTWAQGFPKMREDFDSGRKTGTPMKPASGFVGFYWNDAKTWYFEIYQEPGDDTLWMAYCGDRAAKYKLEHYHYDTLSFILTYEESQQRGLWPVPSANAYLLNFEGAADGKPMQRILWKCSWEEPDGTYFDRGGSPAGSENFDAQKPLSPFWRWLKAVKKRLTKSEL